MLDQCDTTINSPIDFNETTYATKVKRVHGFLQAWGLSVIPVEVMVHILQKENRASGG